MDSFKGCNFNNRDNGLKWICLISDNVRECKKR